MSARWIRVEADIVDHPKTGRLEVLLNNPCAGWYVMRALSWLSRFCPTGHVRDTDGTSLERSCQWSGAPGELLSALVTAGWLDEVRNGGWEWHDWTEHQGKVADRAKKERERKATYRARLRAEADQQRVGGVPQLSHGTSAGRPAQRDETRRDETVVTTLSSSSELDAVGAGREQLVLEPDLQEKAPTTDVALEEKLTDDEFQVFEHWRTKRRPRAKASPERKRIIAKALKLYSVADLQRAIDGVAKSPHHMGQNDRHTVYDDIELILRDAKRIEGFIALAEGRAA